ncbi:MAG: hypothetical protein WA877_09880, partial [Legionella sp.]
QALVKFPNFLEFDDAQFQMEAFQTGYDPAVGQMLSGLFPELSGFKEVHSAKATLTGIELHHMLRKGQHLQVGKQSIFEQFYGLAA